jgi:hypothetical protein
MEKNLENIETSEPIESEFISPEKLEIGKIYKLSAPYTRGKYQGQGFDGEIEFLGTGLDSEGFPTYKFLYIKHPEHQEEVGGGSTYVTNLEGLQLVKELN